VAAFATGSTEFLNTALSDRLHQPFRAHLIPGFEEVLALRAAGLFGCVLSGAGPSILVFYHRGNDGALSRIRETMERCGQTASVVKTSVSLTGFEMEAL
jgi:homoserine kinase